MTKSNLKVKVPSKASPRGFCTVNRVNTRGRIPDLPYTKIKNDILGTDYMLSIAYVDEATSEELHIKWKHAPGPANILSFPYSSKEGEIILHLPTVYAKSREFNHTKKQHLLFLIIHGCLHLKGFTHGNAMEKQESYFLSKFSNIL